MSDMSEVHRVIRPWARWLFRVAISCTAVLGFAQAALAGGFLSGRYPLLELHRMNATLTAVVVIVTAILAVLQWRPGGGPAWAALAGIGLFVAVVGQVFAGYERALFLHVPLGVVFIACSVLLLIWAWRPMRLPSVAGANR
jgi:hypothetical protein